MSDSCEIGTILRGGGGREERETKEEIVDGEVGTPADEDALPFFKVVLHYLD